MWTVYIVRCSDDSLYTGITTDPARRINEHNGVTTGKARSRGAAYTRMRRPVTLVYEEQHPDRSTASQREYQVKRLSRNAKIKLMLKA